MIVLLKIWRLMKADFKPRSPEIDLRGISKYCFVLCICFRSYAYFEIIKCRIVLNARGSTRSFSLWPKRSEVLASEARSCYWTKPAAQYEFHSTMARKKQTTTKSRRKQKDILKLTAECPVCKWTTRFTTPENVRCEWLFHLLQIHDLTPVPQVEDSEDKAACQPTQQVHEAAPVRQVEDSEDEAACQPTQ